jgi:hypothetical protein
MTASRARIHARVLGEFCFAQVYTRRIVRCEIMVRNLRTIVCESEEI